MSPVWDWGVADNANIPHCWIENSITGRLLIVEGVSEEDQAFAEEVCNALNK